MAFPAYRYLRINVADTSAHRNFLLSHFDKSQAAFVKNEASESTVLDNTFALMLVAEHSLAEDVHTISARNYLAGHATTRDAIPRASTLVSGFSLALKTRDCPEHLSSYLLGARCFWECRASPERMPYELPFSYLSDEPSFEELHHRIAKRRRNKEKGIYLFENTIPHWKLGTFTSEFPS